jgi:hypothetical protein
MPLILRDQLASSDAHAHRRLGYFQQRCQFGGGNAQSPYGPVTKQTPCFNLDRLSAGYKNLFWIKAVYHAGFFGKFV